MAGTRPERTHHPAAAARPKALPLAPGSLIALRFVAALLGVDLLSDFPSEAGAEVLFELIVEFGAAP